MLAFLARFLLLLSSYLVLTRLLRVFLRPGARRSAPEAASAGSMVRDPVCGMYLDRRLATRLEHHARPVYFCSEECRRKFLAAPPDPRSPW